MSNIDAVFSFLNAIEILNNSWFDSSVAVINSLCLACTKKHEKLICTIHTGFTFIQIASQPVSPLISGYKLLRWYNCSIDRHFFSYMTIYQISKVTTVITCMRSSISNGVYINPTVKHLYEWYLTWLKVGSPYYATNNINCTFQLIES